MTALKSWFPFRFSRQSKRPRQDVPATTKNNNDGRMTVAGMRDEMDRMFDRMWSNPLAAFENTDRWFGDFSSADFTPRLDVSDDPSFLKLTLEAPGVDREDLDIEFEDGMLVVSGEKRQKEANSDEGWYRTECSYGAFRRTIPLPDEVDATKAEATIDKGVVTIKVPKTESAKKRAIQIPIKS